MLRTAIALGIVFAFSCAPVFQRSAQAEEFDEGPNWSHARQTIADQIKLSDGRTAYLNTYRGLFVPGSQDGEFPRLNSRRSIGYRHFFTQPHDPNGVYALGEYTSASSSGFCVVRYAPFSTTLFLEVRDKLAKPQYYVSKDRNRVFVTSQNGWIYIFDQGRLHKKHVSDHGLGKKGTKPGLYPNYRAIEFTESANGTACFFTNSVGDPEAKELKELILYQDGKIRHLGLDGQVCGAIAFLDERRVLSMRSTGCLVVDLDSEKITEHDKALPAGAQDLKPIWGTRAPDGTIVSLWRNRFHEPFHRYDVKAFADGSLYRIAELRADGWQWTNQYKDAILYVPQLSATHGDELWMVDHGRGILRREAGGKYVSQPLFDQIKIDVPSSIQFENDSIWIASRKAGFKSKVDHFKNIKPTDSVWESFVSKQSMTIGSGGQGELELLSGKFVFIDADGIHIRDKSSNLAMGGKETPAQKPFRSKDVCPLKEAYNYRDNDGSIMCNTDAQTAVRFPNGLWVVIPNPPAGLYRHDFKVLGNGFIVLRGRIPWARRYSVLKPAEFEIQVKDPYAGEQATPGAPLSPNWTSPQKENVKYRCRSEFGQWSDWQAADKPFPEITAGASGKRKLFMQFALDNALVKLKTVEFTFESKYNIGKVCRELIPLLSNPSFKKRQSASEQLQSLGQVAVPYLTEALNNPDAELRARAELLIERIQKAGSEQE